MMSVPPDSDDEIPGIDATGTSTTGLAPMAPPPGLELEREVGNLIREEPEKDATSPHALEPQVKTRQESKEDACHDACVVCMDKDREFAAIPCGHLCTCKECSSKQHPALADVKWIRIYCRPPRQPPSATNASGGLTGTCQRGTAAIYGQFPDCVMSTDRGPHHCQI